MAGGFTLLGVVFIYLVNRHNVFFRYSIVADKA